MLDVDLLRYEKLSEIDRNPYGLNVPEIAPAMPELATIIAVAVGEDNLLSSVAIGIDGYSYGQGCQRGHSCSCRQRPEDRPFCPNVAPNPAGRS